MAPGLQHGQAFETSGCRRVALLQQEALCPPLGWVDTLMSCPLVRGPLGSVVRKQRCQSFWDTLQVYGDHQTESLKSDAFPESPSWKLRGIWSLSTELLAFFKAAWIPQAGKARDVLGP